MIVVAHQEAPGEHYQELVAGAAAQRDLQPSVLDGFIVPGQHDPVGPATPGTFADRDPRIDHRLPRRRVVAVADRERETATNLFRDYAEARTVEGQGRLMAWITEQVPDVSPEIYKDLQARLTAGRQEYRGAQTYMLELVRAHTNIVEDPFRSMFIKDTTPFAFTVISSSATKVAVTTGEDERVFTISSRQ